jgi:hypothetical protein
VSQKHVTECVTCSLKFFINKKVWFLASPPPPIPPYFFEEVHKTNISFEIDILDILPQFAYISYMKLYLRIHHYGLPFSPQPVNKKYTFDVVYYSIFQYGDYPSDYDFSDTSSDSL